MKNKQGLLIVIGNFVYLVSQWLMTVLVVRLSSDYEMAGILGLTMTITSVFYIVSCYGMRSFQVSDINKEYADQHYLLSRIITVIVSFVACVVYTYCAGYSDSRLVFPIILYMLYKSFEAASDVIYGVFQIYDRYDYICYSMCAKGGLSLIAFIGALIMGGSLSLAFVFMNAIALGTFVLMDLRWCQKYVNPLFFLSSEALRKTVKLLKASAPMVAILISQPLLMSIPRLFFERHFSTELLGVYSSISSPTVVISTFVSCVMTPYVPLFAQYYYGGEQRKLYRLTFGSFGFAAAFGIVALIGGALLGEWALVLLYGESIRGYTTIFLLVIIVTTLSAITMCLNSLFIALRKLGILSFILLAGCALCYWITSYFVTAYAMAGITFALMVSQLFQITLSLIMGVFYIKKMPT